MPLGSRSLLTAVLVLGLLAAGRPGWAEDAQPAPAAAPAPKPAASAAQAVKDIKDALGLSIYLQGGYTYNLRSPASGENDLRVFDHKANSFGVDLAELVFDRAAPATGGLGYHLKLSAGETAKFIHALGLGINPGEDPNTSEAFDLTEAYITAVAPVGNGLQFKFGKFVTMHGAEVIEAGGDWNYSRSFLFNYAIPFTHTGLMVAYPVKDWLSLSFHVVNGWDAFDDNNNGKTFGYSINVTPFEALNLVVNLMNGPEQTHNSSNQRYLADVVATWKTTKALTLMANYDYGYEQNVPAIGGTAWGKNAPWQGIAGYGRYQFNDWIATSLRAERFNDRTGFRTTGVAGQNVRLYEVTLTPEFKVYDALLIRPEYRHDWSPENVFDLVNGTPTKKTQDTLALGLIYNW
jgi:hypothetical protein